jgi:flagellar basal body-associated protein FliL
VTWEVMLLVIVIVVALAALGAWVMWLVHDSAPVEVDQTEG